MEALKSGSDALFILLGAIMVTGDLRNPGSSGAGAGNVADGRCTNVGDDPSDRSRPSQRWELEVAEGYGIADLDADALERGVVEPDVELGDPLDAKPMPELVPVGVPDGADGLRGGTRVVDDAVPMIRRRVERV